jgi:ABC-type multidrug transport system fused ATPase/permease subunit
MLKKADDYNSEQTEIMRKQSRSIFGFKSITNTNIAATEGLSYLYLGYKALSKRLSIGDFTMMSAASSAFSGSLNSIISEILGLQIKCTYAYKFVDFMKSKDFMPASGENHCEDIEKCTIEFKNVYFAYPGSGKYVLEDVSLKIKSGEHLSIVGLNGSGKSTFIKLLCRLYPVNKGEILLNGINIQDYDYKEYNNLISVVFQDFKLLPFTLKENIAFKNAQTIEDRALEPLIKKVGLAKKVEDLKKGLHTHLFKYYEIDGFEPSGGEQQKIAIARALYKNAPIVVLDEPTAALDPMAEYEIYKQFNELVAGKTAFYISHRLSSCKFCDKIVVFSEGRIKEYGTHQELLKYNQGLYSEMYRTQAQYYS